MILIKLLSLITIILTAAYMLLLLFFKRGWRRLQPLTTAYNNNVHTVSIIVAARNEEDNIAETIQCLLAQTYSKRLTEIIIIDDHSTDDTAAIVNSFSPQGVKLIQLNESSKLNSYKKKAIQTAISQSTSQLILVTDADCRMGPHWLKTIIDFYRSHNYKMISCPVSYHRQQGIFQQMQSLEFLFLIGLGAATIGNNDAATCNGANLLYEREAFTAVGGFTGIDNLASGDDELLLHKVHAKYPGSVGFLKDMRAMVYTDAKPDLPSFIAQRKRWASKSTRYKNRYVIAMGVGIWFFNLLFIINVIIALLHPAYWYIPVIQYGIKALSETLFLVPVTRFTHNVKLIFYTPVLSALHIIYIVYIGLAGNSGTYNWKGRQVK